MAARHFLHIPIEKPLLDNFKSYEQEQQEDETSRPPSPKAVPVCRDANYPQSYWNYERIQSLAIDSRDEDEKREKRIENLKNEVKILLNNENDVFEQLEMVDALEQLGVAYHFEKEVHDILTTVQGVTHELISQKPDNLHAISQLFRVLRNYGYEVSHDVFKNFKEENGGFKASVCLNPKGMLSLYEASFLGMVDEDTMDEAKEFTVKYLNELLTLSPLDPHFKFRLAYALELPIHRRITRLHARWSIDAYSNMDCMNPMILEFAKLDFNAVQNMYKKELKDLSRWWNNLGFGAENMGFFRNRLMECFYWALGAVPEPKFQKSRILVTKIACLITIVDDFYDVYGTLDELQLLTEAIHRWDASIINELPKCMKMCFLAIFNLINDVGYSVFRDKDVDVTPLLKRSVEGLCDSYNQEAKWYHEGYMPSTKEHMDNAWISTVWPALTTFAYCTSEVITLQAVEQYELYSDMIRSSSIIIRYLDDLVTATAELARGGVPTSIQCYMFEKGVSETVARRHIKKMITEQWKILNYDIPKSICMNTYRSMLLGGPRTSHIIYQYGDGFGEPNEETKERIESLIKEPIPL